MTDGTKNSDLLVVGICGSLRKTSYTRMALQLALEGAQEFGVRTKLIDLRDFNLVFCDGNQDENAYPEDVFRLRSEVVAAQGIILGTPNYHASFSGVLKNASDPSLQSPSACGCVGGGAVCAKPWPRSAECAPASRQTCVQPRPAYARARP